MNSKLLQKIAWGVALVVFVAGLVGLYQRFALGHQGANYGSYVPWGLWIAAYTMLVGASAGAFALAALIYTFKIESYYRLAWLATLVALAAFVAGMINVSLDLGHPFRAWKLILQTSTNSVMGWMAWFYLIYGILLVVGLWLTRNGQVPKFMQQFGWLAFIFAVMFAGAEGALFGVIGARGVWESGLTPILFLVEGSLFGLGLTVAAAFLFDELKSTLATRLGQVLLVLLAALIVLEWAEFSTGLYAAVPGKSHTLQTILTGPYWWVFWIFHVGLGVVLPAVLLLFGRSTPLAVATAGLLVGAMGLASKLNLVVPALAQEELEGLSTAFTGPGLSFVYFPSSMEWLVWLWTIGLAMLLVLAGHRVLGLMGGVTATSPAADQAAISAAGR